MWDWIVAHKELIKGFWIGSVPLVTGIVLAWLTEKFKSGNERDKKNQEKKELIIFNIYNPILLELEKLFQSDNISENQYVLIINKINLKLESTKSVPPKKWKNALNELKLIWGEPPEYSSSQIKRIRTLLLTETPYGSYTALYQIRKTVINIFSHKLPIDDNKKIEVLESFIITTKFYMDETESRKKLPPYKEKKSMKSLKRVCFSLLSIGIYGSFYFLIAKVIKYKTFYDINIHNDIIGILKVLFVIWKILPFVALAIILFFVFFAIPFQIVPEIGRSLKRHSNSDETHISKESDTLYINKDSDFTSENTEIERCEEEIE